MRKGILFLLSLNFLLLSTFVLANTNIDATIKNTLVDGDIVNLSDTVYLQTSNCLRKTPLCISEDISAVDMETNYIITDGTGAPYANGLSFCGIDTSFSYNYTQLIETESGAPIVGPYNLTWRVGDSTYTGQNYLTIQDLVIAINDWDTVGNWVLNASINRIQGGSPVIDYGPLVVTIQQLGISVNLNRAYKYDPIGTTAFFDVGLTKMSIQSQADPSIIDEFYVSVACVEPEEIYIDTLFPGVTDSICLDFSELAGDVVSVTNICDTDGQVAYQLVNNDSCVIFVTQDYGIDSACIVACNANGICDTTTIIIDVQNPNPPRTIYSNYNTYAGAPVAVHCIDTSLLTSVDTLYSICEPDQDYVQFSLDTASLCVAYRGLVNGGADTFCLVTCDAQLSCDTNYIVVNVERQDAGLIQDTILINREKTVCTFPGLLLPSGITQIENTCANQTTGAVDFSIDATTNCLEIVGASIGVDTACLRFTDNLGNLDSIIYVVHVVGPTNDFVSVDVPFGNTTDVCIDVTELSNPLDTIYICEDLTTGVNYTANNTTLCLSVEGVSLNQADTLCVAVCDDFNVCDTTTYSFRVIESGSAPILGNDTVTIALGETIQINVCPNDSVPGTITSFFVLPKNLGGAGPDNGIAFRDTSACVITYIPSNDSCGMVDKFTYVTENEFGSDTADVVVIVDCNDNSADLVKVYNGFSPNKDGVNDYFKIEGLEEFPNHVVKVFNRWGNQVLEAKNYQNTWNGNWGEIDLPDGTYFYLIDLGNGQQVSGFVYVRR